MIDSDKKKFLESIEKSFYLAELAETSVTLSWREAKTLLGLLRGETARADKWRKLAEESQAEYGEKLTGLDLAVAKLKAENERLQEKVRDANDRLQNLENWYEKELNASRGTQ